MDLRRRWGRGGNPGVYRQGATDLARFQRNTSPGLGKGPGLGERAVGREGTEAAPHRARSCGTTKSPDLILVVQTLRTQRWAMQKPCCVRSGVEGLRRAMPGQDSAWDFYSDYRLEK